MAGILILALAYIVSHFYRSFLAVLSPALSAELGITPAQLSDALGWWFMAFALSQFLVGVMLDRFGPKWTTAGLFAVCAGGGGFLFASAQTIGVIKLAMVLLGIGCAPVLMASVYLFKRSYDARKFALLASVFIAVGLLGNILGSSPLAAAMEAYGWRSVMLGLSVMTLVLSLLTLVTVQDPPRIVAGPGNTGGYWEILKLRELWLILPLIFVNYGVAGGLRGLWAGPYLDLVHGLTAAGIGAATLWMAIAMAAGSFAYGPADQIFNTRKWVVSAGSGVTFLSLLYWAFNPGISANGATYLLVSIGFFALCYGVLMAHATANIPDHLAGRGVTLVNFFNMAGVGVMQWFTAEVYRQTNVPDTPVAGFEAVLWVYVICFGAAFVLYLFSKDAKPRQVGS